MSELTEALDVFFNRRPAREPEKTTDRPNFRMLFFQVVNSYADLLDASRSMAWEKTLANKATGKRFKVTVKLEEVESPAAEVRRSNNND